jgi:hypothetical protein
MAKLFIQPSALQALCDEAVAEQGRRADANETLLVAQSLTAASIKVVGTIYPGMAARQLVTVNPKVGPGAKKFTWHRMDHEEACEFIENAADDVPLVDAFTTEMEGKTKGLASGFKFTTDDARRIIFAKSQGRQQDVTLEVNKMQLVDESIERKKDKVFAHGDATHNLPGMLSSSNVTQVDAAASLVGGFTRSWVGADKTPMEILADLRAWVDAVFNQSHGKFIPNGCVMPINRYRKIASTPVDPSHGNYDTILQAFQKSNRDSGIGDLKILMWNECLTADGGNPRGLLGHFSAQTIELIDPMGLVARPPQSKNFADIVPVESAVGGTVIYQPLAFAYMDQF